MVVGQAIPDLTGSGRLIIINTTETIKIKQEVTDSDSEGLILCPNNKNSF